MGRALAKEVTIPDAVYDEAVVQGAGQPGAEEVGNAAWIEKQSVANLNLVRALRWSRRCL